MADDNNARYRSNEPFGGGPASATPANDPLAELARLIGQNDPFAENGRDARAPAQPAPDTKARYDERSRAFVPHQPDAAVSERAGSAALQRPGSATP